LLSRLLATLREKSGRKSAAQYGGAVFSNKPALTNAPLPYAPNYAPIARPLRPAQKTRKADFPQTSRGDLRA